MEKKDRKDKEEKLKEEKEKEEIIKTEIESISSGFDKSRLGIKLGPYLEFLGLILAKWNLKIKDKDIIELLGSSTAKILDYGLKDKELTNFADSLSETKKIELLKVIYAIHERISKKLQVFGIKSSKLFVLHSKIIQNDGIGTNCRAIFSIQK